MHGLFSKVSATTQGITMSIKREAASMYSQYQQNIQASNENKDKPENEVAVEENPFQVPVPPGTIPPGTFITVGSFNVMIEKHLAEGGFAHVYVVQNQDGKKAVLKQIIVPDKEQVLIFQKEINFMKIVNGNENIVHYFDSQIRTRSQNEGEGYEILILMEYCSGGHIVDLMNSRLQVRLNENEILSIFTSVCKAVAHLHYQNPPIIHRDIKVENVLITSDGKYKLCDFGSATTQIIPPNKSLTIQEIHELEDEIQKYTTIQYRPPEMCDIYQKRGLNEKVDTWALGIMLYKLCYYTTPFEDGNTLAILNCRYTKPSVPTYSNNIYRLIDMMLVIEPYQRATIYDIMLFLSNMQGVPCPITNKYQYSESSPVSQPKINDASFFSTNSVLTTKKQPVLTVPIVQNANPVPMRRGRPNPKDRKVNPATNANAVVASKLATLSYNSQQMQQSGLDTFKTTPSKNNQEENIEDPSKKSFFYAAHKKNDRNSYGMNTTLSSIELNQMDMNKGVSSQQALDSIFGKSTNDLFDTSPSNRNDANFLFDDDWLTTNNQRKSFDSEKKSHRKSYGGDSSNSNKLPRPPSFTQLQTDNTFNKEDEARSAKTNSNASKYKNDPFLSNNPFSSDNDINGFDDNIDNTAANIQLFEADFNENSKSLLDNNNKKDRLSFYDNNEKVSIKSINTGNSNSGNFYKTMTQSAKDNNDNISPYSYVQLDNEMDDGTSSLNLLNEKAQNLLSTNSSQIISSYNNNNNFNTSSSNTNSTTNTTTSTNVLNNINTNNDMNENRYNSFESSNFPTSAKSQSFFDSNTNVIKDNNKVIMESNMNSAINTNTATSNTTTSTTSTSSHTLNTNKLNQSFQRLALSLKSKQSKRGKHMLLSENSFDNDDEDSSDEKEEQQQMNAMYVTLEDDDKNDDILIQNGKLKPPKYTHTRYPSDSLYSKKTHQKSKSMASIPQDNYKSLNFEPQNDPNKIYGFKKENENNINVTLPSSSSSNINSPLSGNSSPRKKVSPAPPPKPPQLSKYVIPKVYPGLPPRQSSQKPTLNTNNGKSTSNMQQQFTQNITSPFNDTSIENPFSPTSSSSNTKRYSSLSNINSQRNGENNNDIISPMSAATTTSTNSKNHSSYLYNNNNLNFQNIDESYSNTEIELETETYSDENDSDQDIFGSKSNKKKSKFKLLRGSNKLI